MRLNTLASAISISSVFALFCSSSTSLVAQDRATLQNGDTLLGKLLDSEKDGIYVLQHDESDSTFNIKEEFITSLEFEQKEGSQHNYKERVQLINGDQFSCKILSFEGNNIIVSNSYMGKHTIPKDKIKRIYFKNKAHYLIYEDPGNDIASWSMNDNEWQENEQGYHTNQHALLGKKISNLPQNFQFDFTATWTGKTPRFRVFFCAESVDTSDKKNNFYLDVSASDMRVTHYNNRRIIPLGFHTVKPDFYADQTAKFTLYVNRDNNTITLYYNNNKIKDFSTKVVSSVGSNILFNTLQRSEEGLTISDISIASWNGDTFNEAKANKESLKNNDILHDTKGNKMTGKLVGITQKNNQTHIDFDIVLAKNASSIPANKIHYIDLQQSPPSKKTEQKHTMLASIPQGGMLTYTQSSLKDNQLHITHPIIGELKINKNAVSKLTATHNPIAK